MKTKLIYEELDITPEIAAEMLKHNCDNRPISQAFVRSYADTLKRNEWMLNGEDIIFDKEGHIINGQHRLQAIIASGCTVRMGIKRGVEPKAFTTYDNGRNRTGGQLLQMQGYANGNIAASVVKLLHELRSGNIGAIQSNNNGVGSIRVARPTDSKLTNMHIVILFDKERERILNAISSTGYVNNIRRYPLSRSIIAAYYIYLHYDLDYEFEVIDKFFKDLVSYHSSTNPYIEGLRVAFLKDRDNDTHMEAKKRINLLYSTWNDCMSEKPLKPRKNGKIEYVPRWREEQGNITLMPRKSFEGRQLLLELTLEDDNAE